MSLCWDRKERPERPHRREWYKNPRIKRKKPFGAGKECHDQSIHYVSQLETLHFRGVHENSRRR